MRSDRDHGDARLPERNLAGAVDDVSNGHGERAVSKVPGHKDSVYRPVAKNRATAAGTNGETSPPSEAT